jgi:hypothetical protein
LMFTIEHLRRDDGHAKTMRRAESRLVTGRAAYADDDSLHWSSRRHR